MKIPVTFICFIFQLALAHHQFPNPDEDEVERMIMSAKTQQKYLSAQMPPNPHVPTARDVIIPMPPPAEFQPDYRCHPAIVLSVIAMCVVLGMLLALLAHWLSS